MRALKCKIFNSIAEVVLKTKQGVRLLLVQTPDALNEDYFSNSCLISNDRLEAPAYTQIDAVKLVFTCWCVLILVVSFQNNV